MSLKSLNTFLEIAKSKPRKRVVVAAAEDEAVLKAIASALNENLIEPILVGNQKKITALAKKLNMDLTAHQLIEESEPALAAQKCVRLIRDGQADVLMKGLVATPDFLRAILHKETGLRKGSLLSHVGFFESPHYHKLLALTDAAQNVAPTLEDKIAILKNTIEVFHRLGISNPKIAAIAAIETVNPNMESTVHAAILTQKNRRGQIKGCLIDGPLGTDNAVSKEAADHKGIVSDVAGDADLLLAHDLNTGNGIYKTLIFLGGASVASVLLGAKIPIVLTSRADTEKSKLMSIALACAL